MLLRAAPGALARVRSRGPRLPRPLLILPHSLGPRLQVAASNPSRFQADVHGLEAKLALSFLPDDLGLEAKLTPALLAPLRLRLRQARDGQAGGLRSRLRLRLRLRLPRLLRLGLTSPKALRPRPRRPRSRSRNLD